VRALDPDRPFHVAISAALASACDAIQAAHAAVWTPSPENGELHCIALHQQDEQMSPFRTATMRRAFRPGIELPGSIWASQGPEWIPDVTRERRFVRAFAADSCGIGTGAGFPMRIDGALAAVIEFMFLGQVTPTGAMISFIEEFAGTLGAFIKATRARRALRAGEERFLFILERPEDLAFRWRYQPQQHCTYVSPAVAAIFGYPREAWYADPRFMSRAVLDEDRPLLEERLAYPEVTDPLVLRLRSAAGDVVWTEQHTFPVYDDADSLLSLDGRTRIILPQTSWGVTPDVPGGGHRE
jgi:PAS domain-containing protein